MTYELFDFSQIKDNISFKKDKHYYSPCLKTVPISYFSRDDITHIQHKYTFKSGYPDEDEHIKINSILKSLNNEGDLQFDYNNISEFKSKKIFDSFLKNNINNVITSLKKDSSYKKICDEHVSTDIFNN